MEMTRRGCLLQPQLEEELEQEPVESWCMTEPRDSPSMESYLFLTLSEQEFVTSCLLPQTSRRGWVFTGEERHSSQASTTLTFPQRLGWLKSWLVPMWPLATGRWPSLMGNQLVWIPVIQLTSIAIACKTTGCWTACPQREDGTSYWKHWTRSHLRLSPGLVQTLDRQPNPWKMVPFPSWIFYFFLNQPVLVRPELQKSEAKTEALTLVSHGLHSVLRTWRSVTQAQCSQCSSCRAHLPHCTEGWWSVLRCWPNNEH